MTRQKQWRRRIPVYDASENFVGQITLFVRYHPPDTREPGQKAYTRSASLELLRNELAQIEGDGETSDARGCDVCHLRTATHIATTPDDRIFVYLCDHCRGPEGTDLHVIR